MTSENPREFRPSRSIPITAVDIASGKPPRAEIHFNRKVGHLTIGPNRPIGRAKKIYATCDCGSKNWYPMDELERMVRERAGCGTKTCTALSFGEAVWRTPEATRLQLFTLLLIRPEEVESLWGGTADDVFEVPFEQAVENLNQYLVGQGCTGLWLARKDKLLPFMQSNVTLGNRPDPMMSQFSDATVEVEGVKMSMKELCSIGNMNASSLLLTLYERGTTDDLLVHLMENN